MSQQQSKIRLLILHAQANNNDCGGSFQMLKHFLKGVDHSIFDIHCILSLLDSPRGIGNQKFSVDDQSIPQGKSAGDPNSGAWQILESLGVKVHVQYVPVNQSGSSPVALVKYFFEVVGATLRVRRFIRQNEIDIVYTNTINMLPGGLAAKMAGAKSVYHIHEIVRRPKVVAKTLARIVGKLADRLLCVSKAAMQPFRDVGVPEAKLVHVPNCIDLKVFDESRDGQHIRAEFLRNEREKLVVAVGRLVPKKGFHELIEAAQVVVAQIPDCRFLCVGDTKNLSAKNPDRVSNPVRVKRVTGDAYKQKLLHRIDELDLQEHILFAGPRSDIPEIMAAADAAVLISAQDATPESFGLVILEALAMGTPVVATAMGGIPELLQDGQHGELVPPHDPPALADGLIRLLQDAGKAREMGEAGRQWVRQEFSGEEYSGKVQRVLVGVVGGTRQIETKEDGQRIETTQLM